MFGVPGPVAVKGTRIWSVDYSFLFLFKERLNPHFEDFFYGAGFDPLMSLFLIY